MSCDGKYNEDHISCVQWHIASVKFYVLFPVLKVTPMKYFPECVCEAGACRPICMFRAFLYVLM